MIWFFALTTAVAQLLKSFADSVELFLHGLQVRDAFIERALLAAFARSARPNADAAEHLEYAPA